PSRLSSPSRAWLRSSRRPATDLSFLSNEKARLVSRAFFWSAGRRRLFRDAQLGELGADLVEQRSRLRDGGDKEEAAGVGRAILQHRRRRVAAGVDLHSVDREAGGLGVVAQDLLPRVDLRGVGVPAILRVQAVRQDHERVLLGRSSDPSGALKGSLW